MESTIKYPKFRWFVFITMITAVSSSSVVMISPSPLVGEIAATLGVNLGTVTALSMALFNFSMGIGAILGGYFIDKIGIARSYLAGLILMGIGTILVPLCGSNLTALAVLRVICGIGAAPVVSSIARLAAEWFPMRERALVAGVHGMAISLGVALGFLFTPMVFQATGNWPAALASSALLCAISIILALVMVLGPKPPTAACEGRAGQVKLKPYLSHRVTWVCVLSITLLSWAFSAFNDLTPGYLAVQPPVGLGKGPVEAGRIMTIYQIAFMAGSVASGFLVQKTFKGNEKPVVLLSFLLAALFTLALKFPLVAESSLLFVCLIAAGFVTSMANPSINSFIAKKYPTEITGAVGGLAMGIGIFGSSIGVLVGSIALGRTGDYQMSIAIISMIAVGGAINALGLSGRQGRR